MNMTYKEILPGIKLRVIESTRFETNCISVSFMSEISDNCLRFTPFTIDGEQLESIHGENENVNVSALPKAVDFYKTFIEEAQKGL